MSLKSALLRTTALALAGVGLCMTTTAPRAAEVMPGGALDIEVSGFARFLAHGGDLDNAQLDPDLSTGLDFSNDTEVHFIVEGESAATGLEYGGTVEFEADTNTTANTDETWVFLSGGWGELRFGDEDGVADNSSVAAQNIAAGTGGLDADIIDDNAIGLAFLTGTSDATKIRYYTPELGGLQLGVSYTPNLDGIDSGSNQGSNLAAKDVEAGDVFEAGIVYDAELAGLGVQLGLVGVYGDIKTEDEDLDGDGVDDGVGGDDFWGYQLGAVTELFGFQLAAAWALEQVGASEKGFYNLGAAYKLGIVNMSVNWGQVVISEDLESDDGDEFDKPQNLVLSADVGLMPGLTLATDVSFFDHDVDGEPVGGTEDDGIIALARLGLAF